MSATRLRRTVNAWTPDDRRRRPRPSEPALEPPVERGVVIVTFDTAQILDVTGPLEVFSSASRFLPAVRYRTQVVTTTRRSGARQLRTRVRLHPHHRRRPVPSTR